MKMLAVARGFIAAVAFGFGLEVFCQGQAFDAAFYKQAVREATEEYRGDVHNVVFISSGYDYIPLFRIPTEFQEELDPFSAVPLTLRITLRPVSNRPMDLTVGGLSSWEATQVEREPNSFR